MQSVKRESELHGDGARDFVKGMGLRPYVNVPMSIRCRGHPSENVVGAAVCLTEASGSAPIDFTCKP